MNYPDPVALAFLHSVFLPLLPIIAVLVIWTFIIKGFALWHAARGNERVWFVILLIVNTFGILEIIYLVWFRKDKSASAAAPAPAPAPSSAPEA